MPRLDILREVQIIRTPRLLQMESIFDVPSAERSVETWAIDFDLPEQWNVGLIVGPSGAGKSTIARELFPDAMADSWEWPEDKSVVDGFPKGMSIKEITSLLCSVGFSSPPSWVRPFRVLSNGEQFRVHMARTLAEMPTLCVADEFTSVVDRTVAQIGSAAIAKTVRRRGQKFVAVTCHYDVAEWLEPDWVYQPHTGEFFAGRRERRPPIELTIRRVDPSAWRLFRKHHYLSSILLGDAKCFAAFLCNRPVAFVAVTHFPHPKTKRIMREHRLVCLPDFQGVGIGNALSEWAGQYFTAQGKRYRSISSHPAVNAYRGNSPHWSFQDASKAGAVLAGRTGALTGQLWKRNSINTRLTQTFEFVAATQIAPDR